MIKIWGEESITEIQPNKPLSGEVEVEIKKYITFLSSLLGTDFTDPGIGVDILTEIRQKNMAANDDYYNTYNKYKIA